MTSRRSVAAACLLLSLASLGCSPTPSTAVMKDCDAIARLATAAGAIPALQQAVSSRASKADLAAAADAVFSPVKDVLPVYSSSSRTDDQAAAIRTAVEDIADGSSAIERAAGPGGSAPASGTGSIAWASAQLAKGADEVAAAATLLRSSAAPGQAVCP